MPRRPKSIEEMSFSEDVERFEGTGITKPNQKEKDLEERNDELERGKQQSQIETQQKNVQEHSVKRQTPRKRKIEEVAEIEKAKADIIKTINEKPSEEMIWEKETGLKKEEKSYIEQQIKRPEARRRTPVSRSTRKMPEEEIVATDIDRKDRWETKYVEKLQQSKQGSEKKTPWWKKVLQHPTVRKLAITAGFAAIPAGAAATTDSTAKPIDTLGNDAKYAVSKNLEMKKEHPRLTEIKEIVDNKKFGDVTLLGRRLVPYHNDSLEVCVAYFDGKENDPHAIDKIVKAMASLGYEPGDAKLLQEIVEENPKLAKQYLMSPIPFMDRNDENTQEVINVRTENLAPAANDNAMRAEEFQNNGSITQKQYESTDSKQKTKTTISVLNAAHRAYPTYSAGRFSRFEEDKGIVLPEHGYAFKKKITAQYEEGLASK